VVTNNFVNFSIRVQTTLEFYFIDACDWLCCQHTLDISY